MALFLRQAVALAVAPPDACLQCCETMMLSLANTHAQLHWLCVPHGLGAELPGLEEGPARLLDALSERLGGRPAAEWIDIPAPGQAADPYVQAHHLDRIDLINRRLAERVAAAARAGQLPVVLGGDHTVAIGTWAGLARARPGRRLGLLWIDAHPDLNTPETTPSHHAHGMPLAALLGLGHPRLVDAVAPELRLSPERVALVGIRAIDPGEAAYLARQPALLALHAAEVRARGGAWLAARLRPWLSRLDGLHLSLDLDVLDPALAPGVSTPADHGLTPADLRPLLTLVRESGCLAAVDVVEYLPRRDQAQVTARLAADLLAELLGLPAPVSGRAS